MKDSTARKATGMGDEHPIVRRRHLHQVKNKKQEEPLFRQVPQELVTIWEERNLKDLEHTTLEEVYHHWERLKARSQAIRKTYISLILLLVLCMLSTTLLCMEIVLQNRGILLPVIYCFGVIVTCYFAGVHASTHIIDSMREVSDSESYYWNLIRGFNNRMGFLMILRDYNSFDPSKVLRHLDHLAYHLVLAQYNWTRLLDTPEISLPDRERCKNELDMAKDQFESYAGQVYYFVGYFNPPSRKKLFETVQARMSR